MPSIDESGRQRARVFIFGFGHESLFRFVVLVHRATATFGQWYSGRWCVMHRLIAAFIEEQLRMLRG